MLKHDKKSKCKNLKSRRQSKKSQIAKNDNKTQKQITIFKYLMFVNKINRKQLF